MKQKSVTIEQVIAWRPCGLLGPDDGENYTSQRIERLFAGRETLTAADIAALDISHADKMWALLRNDFLTDAQIHLLACDFAESVVHLCGDDPRPRAAIEAKRSWVRGEIDNDEFAAALVAARAAARAAAGAAARDAAWAAAWAAAGDAAGDTARDAARAAARAAAGDAAGDAAWAAAWAAAGDAQIKQIVEAINA